MTADKCGAGLLDALFDAAIGAVAAARVMPAALPGGPDGRLCVIAAGKAAAAMMAAVRARATVPFHGLVVVPPGHLTPAAEGPDIAIITAGHPVPDAGSLAAAERALALAAGLTAADRLLVLLSGGASALLAAPRAGMALADKQSLTRALLHSGAAIADINTVRQQLSRIKGGGLARAAAPAAVHSWIISDVPGDDPALVGSGPTIAGSGTPALARAIIARHGITPPPAIATALADAGDAPAPLPKGDVRILAQARDALDAAGDLARANGYQVHDLGDDLQGLSRDRAAEHAALALELAATGKRHAIISGGETSVVVTNTLGRGGRNVDYLLALALALDGAPDISALACDSDGIDGNAQAAGARIFPNTLARAGDRGLDARAHLVGNDAACLFDALGDLVVTGPTLTNVNDIRIILITPEFG